MRVGELINSKIEELHLKKADIAKEVDMSPQNFNGLLKRPTIDVVTLSKISVAIGYDFFKHFRFPSGKDDELQIAEEPYNRYGPSSRSVQVTVEIDGKSENLKKWIDLLTEFNKTVDSINKNEFIVV